MKAMNNMLTIAMLNDMDHSQNESEIDNDQGYDGAEG